MVARFWLFPLRKTGRDFLGGHIQRNLVIHAIDRDPITILDDSQGPAVKCFGVMWPTTNPCVPPENRPSVISATSLPNPQPITALVGESISRIPGPPLGPS